MKRRRFLQSVAGLLLWRPWPAATTQQAYIYEYDDGGFLVEVGCLRCCLDSEVLEFNVFVTYYPMPGMERVRRMVPSGILTWELERFGFPSVLEGDERWPSLVARMPRFVTPIEVAEKLQQILRRGDWCRLYHDPES